MSFIAGYLLGLEDGGGNAVIKPINISKNGTYIAPKGIDGYNPIIVGVPENGDGIWDIFNNRQPLVVITIAPNTYYYVFDVGDVLTSYMEEGLYNDTNKYIRRRGYRSLLMGVIQHNGQYIRYNTICSGFGTVSEIQYEYVNGALYQTFNRSTKISAINVANKYISKINSNKCTLGVYIKFYQDAFNFQQYDYEDGSHWESKYAWCPAYDGFSCNAYCDFERFSEFTYSQTIRGDSLEEQFTNWAAVCDAVIDAPNAFPVLSYIKSENHYNSELYTNDDVKTNGYYDANVAFMAKWGTSALWE